MRRFICLILVLLLLTPAVFADGEQLTFYMEDVSGNVGETVSVVGAVKNAPECASFQIIVTYDPAVLEPVRCSKGEVKGMFLQNINYSYQGQKAVNVLSAAAQKIFEGDKTLFTIEFKIIAETAGDHGTSLKVVKQDFFDPTPTRVVPIVEPCTIYVGNDTPAPSGDEEGDTTPPSGETTPPSGETTPPSGGTTKPGGETTPPSQEPIAPGNGENDAPAQPGDTNPEQGDGSNGNTEKPGSSGGNTNEPEQAPSEEPKKEDPKAPTGSWVVDESNDDLYHVDEDGTTTVYVPEYVETPEPGKVTEVILKDKETGEEAGSIKVEGKEDGTFDVVEQDLIKDRVEKSGFPAWGWALVGFAVAAAAIAGVWFFLSRRKKNIAA